MKENKWKKGWKVITKKRESIIVKYRSLGKRKYPINKVVKPKFRRGPLAVFKREEAAIRFRDYWDKTAIIVRCTYLPSDHEKLWWRVFWFDSCDITEEKDLPEGTDFADKVRCLE